MVCFEALPYDEALETEAPGATFSAFRKAPASSTAESNAGSPICREILTLEGSRFPVTEVAVATTVSSSATVVVVALMCCFCPGCFSKKNKNKKMKKELTCDGQGNKQRPCMCGGVADDASTDNTDSSRLNGSTSSSTNNGVSANPLNMLPSGRKTFVYSVSNQQNSISTVVPQEQLHAVLNPTYDCGWPPLPQPNAENGPVAHQMFDAVDGDNNGMTSGSGYLSPRTTLNRLDTSHVSSSSNKNSFSTYYNQQRLSKFSGKLNE